MSSCITYRTFKTEFKLERYLMLPDCVDRINISKFRCRNSKIPVVVLAQAHRNINYENRICPLCNTGEIGDEFHYILQCPTYHLLRKLSKFIAEINRTLN